MSLCAGVIGVAGLFIAKGMALLVSAVAIVTLGVLLLSFILRSAGWLTANRLELKAWMKRTGSALLVTLCALVSLFGLVYLVQDGMFFYNANDPESRAFLQNRQGYHEIEFTAANGKTYHGMMYQASEGKAPLLIYFGGNGECSYNNLRYHETYDRWATFAGYHYLYMDYEGYGANSGQADYLNMYEEALAIYDYAVTLASVDSDHIVAMGYSLGTGSAVYLAANRSVAGLILQAPYANGHDLYNNMLPIFVGPLQLLEKQKLPSEQYAPDVGCPTLIIASRSDEAVPFASSMRLSELITGEVEFMTLDNVSHNGIFQEERVREKIKSFLEKLSPIEEVVPQ